MSAETIPSEAGWGCCVRGTASPTAAIHHSEALTRKRTFLVWKFNFPQSQLELLGWSEWVHSRSNGRGGFSAALGTLQSLRLFQERCTPKYLIWILLLITPHSFTVLFPGALLLLGGFLIARTRYFGKIFPTLGLPAGRRCCAVIRVNPVQQPRDSQLSCCTCREPVPLCPRSKGGPEATWLFFVELSCQPMGLGLPGLARLAVGRCTAVPGAGIAREVEMLLLEREFPPWKLDLPHGGCCRSALPQEPDMGWHFSQQLSQAGAETMDKQIQGLIWKRGKGPLGRKKQLCGQKRKNKKMKDRRYKERSSWHCLCFHAHAEGIYCWRKALCSPCWTQELQGGSGGAKRSVLVIQPETEQMWERKIGAA